MDAFDEQVEGKVRPRRTPNSRLPLRYRRDSAPPASGPVFPFTEMPNEIRARRRAALGTWIRKIVGGFLLLLLALALVVLVLAFAYQLRENPQALSDWSSSLIQKGQDFLQALLSIFE